MYIIAEGTMVSNRWPIWACGPDTRSWSTVDVVDGVRSRSSVPCSPLMGYATWPKLTCGNDLRWPIYKELGVLSYPEGSVINH